MEKAEVLSSFEGLLVQYEEKQGFVEKAQSYADRFNPSVVEKVIRDNTAKAESLAAELSPLAAELASFVVECAMSKEAIESGVDNARMSVEELELRQAIGELTDEEFKSETADLRGELDSAGEKVAVLETEMAGYQAALDRWAALRPEDAAGDEADSDGEDLLGDLESDMPLDDMDLGPAEDAADVLDEPASDDLLEASPDDDGAEAEPLDGFEDVAREGIHMEHVSVKDDVSAIFADDLPMDEDEAGGLFDDGDLDQLGDDALELAPKADDEASEAVAMLVQGEGGSDEHVYPFEGDVMTIGRHRSNHVPVKNDSKVSRGHCKIFKRGSEFFIEDSGSANGTLVNGELLPKQRERMLIGGEQIGVGETTFRFVVQS